MEMEKITWNRGKKLSKEHREKIGLALLGRKRPNLHSEDFKKRQSLRLSGNRHPNWKGGISNLEVRAGRKRPSNCELCGRYSKKICFDHDHKTGKFRGWLCSNCNTAIGHAGEDLEILKKIVEYVEKGGI